MTQRILKFRAFNKSTNQMIHSDEAGNENPIANLGYFFIGTQLTDDPDILYMQFTGLTDKNGKEIYEGDIILVDGFDNSIRSVFTTLYKVIFDNSVLSLISKSEHDWLHMGELAPEETEVIGNIHQNPELIP